jgi:hypothetical protein
MTNEAVEKAIDEIWKLFRETDRKFKETDARLAKHFEETGEDIRQLSALFTGQWGKLIEALVKPDSVRLFRERGIDVHRVFQRGKVQREGETMEIDLILENDEETVVMEVKTTLKVQDVKEFVDKLEEFTAFFPKYGENRVYGGMAAIHIEENADRFAYKQGLFVLTMTGEGMIKIVNGATFRPKCFGVGETP